MSGKTIQIEAIVFRKIRGKYEYLLLKRIESRGGFWQPVTGGLEKGEKVAEAVLREVKEETGITRIQKVIENVYEFILEESPDVTEFVFGLEVGPDEEIRLDKNIYEEHEDYKWCSYSEAMKLLKWPGNKKGLANLDRILEK